MERLTLRIWFPLLPLLALGCAPNSAYGQLPPRALRGIPAACSLARGNFTDANSLRATALDGQLRASTLPPTLRGEIFPQPNPGSHHASSTQCTPHPAEANRPQESLTETPKD